VARGSPNISYTSDQAFVPLTPAVLSHRRSQSICYVYNTPFPSHMRLSIVEIAHFTVNWQFGVHVRWRHPPVVVYTRRKTGLSLLTPTSGMSL
jgi:hypothetical protein